mgnify:CR=1 FL=1
MTYNSDGTTSIVNRWAYYTVRIPCEQFEAFLRLVKLGRLDGDGGGIDDLRGIVGNGNVRTNLKNLGETSETRTAYELSVSACERIAEPAIF